MKPERAGAGAARWVTVFVGLLFILPGCSVYQGPEYGTYDPVERVNRVSFTVTEEVDRVVVKPVARAYTRVLPDFMVTGIQNIFENLRTLDSAINGFLQGKPKSGATDVARFLVNSTVGIAGFFDVATPIGLQYQDQDLGQTLAVWGYTRSSYVYVPFMGPATVRDVPGVVIKASIVPVLLIGDGFNFYVAALDALSVRADRLRDTDARDAAAIESYSFTREAYYQRRRFQIFDGDPPADASLFDELDLLDDFE